MPLVIASAGSARAALTASGSSRNVTATLVPDRDGVEPGKPLWIGIHLAMAPGWHTYWKNPGDSGLPTRIQWRLPPDFTAGELEWPRPERIAADPLMSYGYEHEVMLLAQVRVPAGAAGTATIGGRLQWLECKEACLPGKADLEITLPVAAAPRPLPQWEQAFRTWRERLPRPAGAVSSQAAVSETDVALTVSGLKAPKQAYFFASTPQVVEYAAPQALARAGAGFRLQVPRSANGTVPERIEGVLEADGQAYEIQAPVRGGRAKAPATTVAPPRPSGAPEAPPRPAAPTERAAGASRPAAAGRPGVAPNLMLALAFAFLGGLILNLMPCVLPVLSLKVLGFVQQGGESRTGALRHGLAFTLGVLSFFWLLASALLALRAAGQQLGWGFQLQSPPFVVFLSALFLLVALNLFGVFEVGYSLTAAGNVGSKSTGLLSSFWSGALATIVATPCTAPFMGSAMGFALSQPAWSTLLVFGSLGLGMASPYLALSASPRLLKRLPRPGAWMEGFRQSMGFPMLATVVFLVWLFGRQAGVDAMSALLAALLLIAAGAWLYGRGTAPAAPRLRRVVLITASAVLVASGLALGFSRAQAQPPAAGRTEREGWEPYSEKRLGELRGAGTPVFVDFTADWCLTCQVNHRVALQAPAVRERFAREGVVLMKADWTLRDEHITRALAAHGRQGVPLYVLYGRGTEAAPRLLPEVLTPGVVLQALEDAL